MVYKEKPYLENVRVLAKSAGIEYRSASDPIKEDDETDFVKRFTNLTGLGNQAGHYLKRFFWRCKGNDRI